MLILKLIYKFLFRFSIEKKRFCEIQNASYENQEISLKISCKWWKIQTIICKRTGSDERVLATLTGTGANIVLIEPPSNGKKCFFLIKFK